MLQGIPSRQRLCHTLQAGRGLSGWISFEAAESQADHDGQDERANAKQDEESEDVLIPAIGPPLRGIHLERGPVESEDRVWRVVHGLDSTNLGMGCKGSAGKNRVIGSHICNDPPPYPEDLSLIII